MTMQDRRIGEDDIRTTLADRAADLAQCLLGDPTSRTSRELRWGQRGSLAIAIAGSKAGTFFDHERGEGGDLIGLIMRERSCDFGEALKFARDFCGRHVVRTALPKANGKRAPGGKMVATYDYHDKDGTLLFQVCRFEPKDFRQRKPNGAGWSWSVKGVQHVPYRLPDLIKSNDKVVLVVEGERDVDRLWQLGFPRRATPVAQASGAMS